ncbi:MAG: NAD-dependent epimerase/dehydratase family protein [Planctomycetota bacterium]
MPGATGQRRASAVLITGAVGEVGHGLIRALHARGQRDIVAIDLRELDPELRALCRDSTVGDICDTNLLSRLLGAFEIGEIYHLAALLSTRSEYTPERAHEVNVVGTLNLLQLAAEEARSHGETVTFVYPSSIAAFGLPDIPTKNDAGAVGEDDFLRPATMYGCNKLACEHLGRYYARHYRQLAQDRVPDLIDFRCLRYPGLISAETVPSGGTSDFGPEMIHAGAAGKPYACFVREDARLPFMTMDEAVEATLQLASAPRDGLTRCVYNVASFSASASEIHAETLKHFPGAEVTFAPDEQRQAIVDSWPADVDCSAAKRDWGFTPKHDLASALGGVLVPRIRERYAS